MVSGEDNPVRQLAAAWQAASAVAAEWAERTAAVTAEAFHKLTNDPAIQAMKNWRFADVWPQRACECACSGSHPDDAGVCDHRAVITRKVPSGGGSITETALCVPCAVAQGVAEMPR